MEIRRKSSRSTPRPVSTMPLRAVAGLSRSLVNLGNQTLDQIHASPAQRGAERRERVLRGSTSMLPSKSTPRLPSGARREERESCVGARQCSPPNPRLACPAGRGEKRESPMRPVKTSQIHAVLASTARREEREAHCGPCGPSKSRPDLSVRRGETGGTDPGLQTPPACSAMGDVTSSASSREPPIQVE